MSVLNAPTFAGAGLALAVTAGLLISVLMDKPERQFEALAFVEARVLVAGLGQDVEVWRVRLVESGLRVNARTPKTSRYRVGDCVLVRQFRGDPTTHRDVIVDRSSGCDSYLIGGRGTNGMASEPSSHYVVPVYSSGSERVIDRASYKRSVRPL